MAELSFFNKDGSWNREAEQDAQERFERGMMIVAAIMGLIIAIGIWGVVYG